jgi:hypothetical protein
MTVPFRPAGGVALACSTTSARVALPAGENLLITNLSVDTDAFVVLGSATVVATAARLCIPFRTQVLIARPPGSTYIAGITATGTANLQVETGTGI